MTPGERGLVSKFGSDAAEIATLCHYLSAALSIDPDMALPAQAVDGIQTLSARLADSLLKLGNPG
jgi:hypothetical protein